MVAIVLAAVAVVLWLSVSLWSATRVRVGVTGLIDGTPFVPADAEALDIMISLPKQDDRYRASVTVDGVDVLEDLDFVGDVLRVRPVDLVTSDIVPHALDEGPHEIVLVVGRVFFSDSVFRWRYVVDSVPPSLEVPAAHDPVPIDQPMTVMGTVEEGATVRLDGEELAVDQGRFEVTFEHPPAGSLHFEALDRAGNRSTAESVVPVTYPAGARGVHVSAAGWADEALRAGVLDLVERRLIDTVVLDLKDESGVVGYASKVAAARRIGAARGLYDLREAVRTLEARGVRVVGRLVAFRDPIYAKAAWAGERTDEVLQSPDGEMLEAYGGFTNYVHPAVRRYNLDLALEAVELGVHDILWDYVRRPEGAPATMVVPGLDRPSAEVVVDFLADAHAALRERGAYQGASVFGIAARSGDSIAQDVGAMARVVDYLAPMIYPSHWGPNQYGVASPIREPYEITKRSLADFQQRTTGTGVRLLPWIQDFSLYRVTYGPREVRAQIDAAAEVGLRGFLLWNPGVRYSGDALTPIG